MGVQALRDVSIEVRQNEVVGLIGENGAGKSTLMRTLSGTVRPDGGTLTLDGALLKLRSTRDAAARGVGMVFQEQSLLLNLMVAESICLGQEDRFTRLGLVNWRAMRAAARSQLAKIGVEIDVTARTAALTFAARQMVELAKALTLQDPDHQVRHPGPRRGVRPQRLGVRRAQARGAPPCCPAPGLPPFRRP